MTRWVRHDSRKDPGRLIDAVSVELVVPRVAAQIKELKHQREIVAGEVEKTDRMSFLFRVLRPCWELGSRSQYRSSWPVRCHIPPGPYLAVNAGIAPATRRSGTSIRGESPARSGNK